MTLPFSGPAELGDRLGDAWPVLAGRLLDCAFQPIVEAQTGRTFGYESLMRGVERLGFASPPALLDHAEAAGHLMAIEQQLTERALARFSTLPGHAGMTLFLNLDMRLIRCGAALLSAMEARLGRLGLAPSTVCFELSERFDNAQVPEFGALIDRLRRSGFKLAIDDYGAGHGELKLLCDHPIDYLKIDRHMVTGIDDNPRKRHLFKNIVAMAHALGIRVIAEGIETEGEFAACRDYGADLVQGYFAARPETAVTALAPAYPHLRPAGEAEARGPAAGAARLVERLVRRLPTVQENDSLEQVFHTFRQHPRQTFLPVLNANGEPRGIIKEHRLKAYIYQPFGRDLLRNPSYQRSAAFFAESAPVMDLHADPDALMRIFSNLDGDDGVIMTETMRYVGVVSPAALIKIYHERKLRLAEDQNPLTGLPGNRAVRRHIDAAVRAGGTMRHLVFCDFDNFKPFNDHYGLEAGDKAISMFAALLQSHLGAAGAFIGHIGGDDFFAGLSGCDEARVAGEVAALGEAFRLAVRQLYGPAERQAGYIHAPNRQGELDYFPLMRCSFAILTLPAEAMSEDTAAASRMAAALKQAAKLSDSGMAAGRLVLAPAIHQQN